MLPGAVRQAAVPGDRHLLDGLNDIVRKSGGGVQTEIIVAGRSGEVAIPPPAAKPQPAGLLSRWR